MIQCETKQHLKVLISSIKKIYNKTKVNGNLEIKDLYYLNIISKLLNTLELTEEHKKKLNIFYSDLSYYSTSICRPDVIKKYYTPKIKFVQATKYHCDNVPLVNYNNTDCIKINSIAGAYGLLNPEDDDFSEELLITFSFTTCDGNFLEKTYNYVYTVSDEFIINLCINPIDLKINNIPINNLDDSIFIGRWELKFDYGECD